MNNVLPLVGHMTHEQKAAVRTRVATVVDRLTSLLDDMIAALDQLDGDAEAEGGGDEEPELGWAETEPRWGRYTLITGEPSLGWTATLNQASDRWLGATDDTEDEHDGAEPDVDDEAGGDDEPSLCGQCVTVGRSMVDGTPLWPEQTQVRDSGFDQTHWSSGGDHDLEAEHDGREPELGWTPQEAARLCPYDSRGLEEALEGSDDEREHACTDDNGIADSGGADESTTSTWQCSRSMPNES
jgi:hypothetical protein